MNNKNILGLIVSIAGTFLIIAALIYVMRQYVQPPAMDQARVQERKKYLADIQAANAEVLNNYAWQDQAKGVVRLPITNAMDLIVREYQNPASARSNLSARADKVFAPPPPTPKVPEKPNAFE